MRQLYAGLALAVLLSTTSADAQAPPPRPEPLAPTGLGRCVFDALPREMKVSVVTAYLDGKDIIKVPGFREAVVPVAGRCSGLTDIDHQPAVVGAVLATFWRLAAYAHLAQGVGLKQKDMDAAWRAAPQAQRQPFDDIARSYLDPGPVVQRDAVAEPFIQQLGLAAASTNRAGIQRDVFYYFMATALKEQADRRLSPG